MKYQSLYGFYWFGTCLRYLQDADSGWKIHGAGLVQDNIRRLFSFLDQLQLKVTESLAHAKLDEITAKIEQTEPDATLTDNQAGKLREGISTVRQTLEAEIEGVGAYTPTPKRLDLDRLLKNVASLLAPGVYDVLPEIARYDFAEAGKCIAFERPTAAAFHILRSTEACLRFYYLHMVRSARISDLMWGPIVNDLRRHNLTKKHDILNNHLDNI